MCSAPCRWEATTRARAARSRAALEIVGERWTLLILRDLFFGVRRFTDLQRHLDIPRAVLSARLASLVDGSSSAPYASRERYRADRARRATCGPPSTR